MNNTTNNTNTAQFDQMVEAFCEARYVDATSRLGTKKQVAANAKMDRLVEKAERLGFLTEFCNTVNSTTYTV